MHILSRNFNDALVFMVSTDCPTHPKNRMHLCCLGRNNIMDVNNRLTASEFFYVEWNSFSWKTKEYLQNKTYLN